MSEPEDSPQVVSALRLGSSQRSPVVPLLRGVTLASPAPWRRGSFRKSTAACSLYAAEYGRYDSLADLFMQIGHDERIHKLDSLASLSAPRFGQAQPRPGS